MIYYNENGFLRINQLDSWGFISACIQTNSDNNEYIQSIHFLKTLLFILWVVKTGMETYTVMKYSEIWKSA